MPEAVAFKLVVLFVVSLVPVGHYVFSRRWLSRPAAFLIAALGTAIFMNEADSIGGGSFKSVMAGQVSHQLGLMAVVAFFSYLVRREHDRRGAIFTLAFAVLCHVYSALFAACLALAYLAQLAIESKSLKSALWATRRWWFALGMTSFFWLPFAWYHRWTVIPINHTTVDWGMLPKILQLGNTLYLALYLGAILSVVYLGTRKKKQILQQLIFGLFLLCILFIPFSQGTPILHVRLLAEIYLLALFVCGLALKVWDQNMQFGPRPWLQRWSIFGIAGFLVLQSFVPSSLFDRALPDVLRHEVKEVPTWWAWNMSGIEAKPQAMDVLQVWNFMKTLRDTDGRFAIEYNDYGSYGSPRIFELTPNMTGKSVMEGLLLESSVTYPLYFYSMLESNSATWWPGFNLTAPPVDPLKTIEHLGLYNVRHFIASRKATKDVLKAANYQPSFENNEFSVFDVNINSRIVNRVEGDIPIVSSQAPLMFSVNRLPEAFNHFLEIDLHRGVEAIGPLPKPVQTVTPLDSEWSADGQTIKINDTGADETHAKNIIFKIPYFPNWRASTGEDVHLITGQLMMVKTHARSLSLKFKPGWAEHIAATVSVLSLLFLLIVDLPPFDLIWLRYVERPYDRFRIRTRGSKF